MEQGHIWCPVESYTLKYGECTDNTRAIALSDIDGGGERDVAAVHWSPDKLYLKDGTSKPFNGVSGTEIGTEIHGSWNMLNFC